MMPLNSHRSLHRRHGASGKPLLGLLLLAHLFTVPMITNAYCIYNNATRPITLYQVS